MLTKAGFETAVISNQSGVEKGLFTKKDLKNIDRKIIGGLKGLGGRLSGTYYCTHSSEKNCDCKKPKTGLLKKATKRKRIDHKNSYFVGDTERDIIAGKNFGIKTIAVLSGYYNRKDMMAWQAKPDFIVKDLLTAVKKVILK
jgi:D-glycero-D-manno-heptose 1,7-bisphosphate phosphatase